MVNRQILLPIALSSLFCGTLWSSAAQAGAQHAGDKGAQIYCFMRNSGNEHEVSWKSAYAVIKRQTNSLFKTSPKHSAVMIIEAVVQDPSKYENCGSYLGDLFGSPEQETTEKKLPEKSEVKDRYGY